MIDSARRRRAFASVTLAGLQRLRLASSPRLWIRARLRAAFVLGAFALTLSVGASPASAAIFTVTNTNDSGPGSLRQAVLDANATPGLDTITFSVTGTIALTSGQLTITDHLMIDGPGAAILTISGNNTSRVMEVSAGVTLDLRDVTVANGRFVAAPQLAGAGILNFGTLTVSNSIFLGNDAGGCCFGLAGGAIASSGGRVTVSDSVFSGNVAGGSGGAIYSEAGTLTVSTSTFSQNSTNDHGGGIFHSGGPAVVTNATFSGNSAAFGGAGMWNHVGGTLSVTNTTFSGNSTSPSGGGMVNLGGTVTLTNSTFSGNSAGIGGGGLLNHGGGTATLTNTTFSGNSAGTGGGIWNIDGVLTLRNTIVANSSGGNCSGVIIDGLGNLQHPGTDCGPTIPSADPLLGPLAANDGPAPDPPDGPTRTHALLPGSPAIDTAVLASCPPTDQRGVPRPQGAGCDIGAFELEVAVCPPGDEDVDDDGLDDKSEDLFGNLLNDADSDNDGIRDGNDDGDDDGEDDEDEDDDEDDGCPDEDSDGDGEDDEDEDDEEDDD